MSGRGGARHHPKPYIESGLLYKVLCKHEELVFDMKGYEMLSRNSACDPRSLIQLLPLVSDLVELEPSAEIHPAPLRQCLLKMLLEKAELNTSKYKGNVFVELRAGRLTTLLSHVRRLCRGTGFQACVANLTGLEYSLLKDTLKKVKLSEAQEKDEGGGLERSTSSNALKKEEEEVQGSLKKEEPAAKKLKPSLSDVSVDSKGWPLALASPRKEAASPPRLWKEKRVKAQACRLENASDDSGHPALQDAMGLARKKPAAALKKAKCPTSKPLEEDKVKPNKAGLKKHGHAKPLKKDTAKGKPDGKPLKKEVRKPWAKISKTISLKSERCYLCGAHEGETKKHLIVEVTKKRSLQYVFIIDRIKQALEKDHITKAEALKMREDLCSQFP